MDSGLKLLLQRLAVPWVNNMVVGDHQTATVNKAAAPGAHSLHVVGPLLCFAHPDLHGSLLDGVFDLLVHLLSDGSLTHAAKYQTDCEHSEQIPISIHRPVKIRHVRLRYRNYDL